ncbi:DNA repair protein [Aggregatibacter actinomycetemcomitans]|nr:DNA repair protein [Aggregatibacter actinomycetemcomitans]
MDNIQLFEQKQVRSHWDEEQEQWYFSIVDVVGILTDSSTPKKYWSVLKTRNKLTDYWKESDIEKTPKEFALLTNNLFQVG